MRLKPKKFDSGEMRMRTMLSARRVASALAFADRLKKDPERKARLARQFCKACHYDRGGLAGQAFTTQPCACCNTDQRYSSTNTDSLCLPCAQTHRLCKHCGGDIGMDETRDEI